jgi:hypothetical protein
MPCHAMHPIQDLFLESFLYVLQFDIHFYMHSYVDKKIILVKCGCYKAVDCQFFQWEDVMEQISPISLVPSPPTIVQTIPEVDVLRDRMNRIINYLKWIKKLVCVHSCCSVCNTNEVDGNISVCSYI